MIASYSSGRRRRIAVAAAVAALVVAAFAAAHAAAGETAQYTVRFDAAWSAATHPVDFPGNAHLSPLIGATHRVDQRFWEPGGLATNGIEQMAEEGRTPRLAGEVEAAIAAGAADQVLLGGGIPRSPGATTLSFAIDEDFPVVTLVSMIAPSPDWFVGVSALSLHEGGEWVQERVVNLVAWDAGTDSGRTFRSPDQDTFPPQLISRIQTGPLGNGEPMGTFTFTRTDSTPPPPLALQGGRFLLSAEWETSDGIRGFAHGVGLTSDSGYFWFFSPDNLELVVKVLDACAPFDRFWFFAAGLTNVGVEIRVEDTEALEERTWESPVGQAFAPVQDTEAFSTCP